VQISALRRAKTNTSEQTPEARNARCTVRCTVGLRKYFRSLVQHSDAVFDLQSFAAMRFMAHDTAKCARSKVTLESKCGETA
jgi:hypothetical protein